MNCNATYRECSHEIGRFQSLIGILVNCNRPTLNANKLSYGFQSLIGILVNCNVPVMKLYGMLKSFNP